MEGPELALARDEFAALRGRRVLREGGNARFSFRSLEGQVLRDIRSWGRYLLLVFTHTRVRIHFLLAGSYRLNSEIPHLAPKLTLDFGDEVLNFYACAIHLLGEDLDELYDWSVDVLSDEWLPSKAVKRVKGKRRDQVCDVLINQEIFAGVGVIMKDEILFRLRMHPERKVESLSDAQVKQLVQETRSYAKLVYGWEKTKEFAKHWEIVRKKICPRCEIPVNKRETGKQNRISYFCTNCQVF